MGLLTMSRSEREEFLVGVHVGVMSVTDPGGPPVAAPVWYSYEPGGDVVIVTGGASRKTELVRKAGVASLCTQTEVAPYRFVTVDGPVVIDDTVDERERERIAHRYLGPELGAAYMTATADESAGSVTLRLRPERWHTADFSKQFGTPD